MQECDLPTTTKIINIIAVCLEYPELLDQTLTFFREKLKDIKQAQQKGDSNNENNTQDNEEI